MSVDIMKIDEAALSSSLIEPSEDENSNGYTNNTDANSNSLIIPVTSSPTNVFIEIFPEEMKNIPVSTLLQVLKDENARLDVWADAALLYMQQKQDRESLTLLEEACEQLSSIDNNNNDNQVLVRILASTGIAQLDAAAAQQRGGRKATGSSLHHPPSGVSGSEEDLRQQADNLFTSAGKANTLAPMTWIGRGMLNLANGRLDQAKFFFQTTLKQCGPVMPALLGMAAVLYGEGDFTAAQEHYGQAIRKFPHTSGATVRVGFGLASYRLGQVDRAKAAFARALELDPECVEAMVGAAVLDMSSLDETARDYSKRTEKAIKMMSMANLLDHSNAMVQNHLANHYFWKWTPVTGSVQVEQGSNQIRTSQQMSLEPGERIRIGIKFETSVVEESQSQEDESTIFTVQHAWKDSSASGLSVWKKDYDRVICLAKGAHGSTSNPEIQAESLFFLARVYHVREDIDTAFRFYEKAVKLAPTLTPARFGLAQTLVVKEDYQGALEHLQQLVVSNTTSSTSTDTLALLGLLQVRTGKKVEEGLGHLRKAIELDPSNADFMLLEALALQQHKTTYAKALDRYQRAIDLMHRNNKKVPHEVYANSGVLCHETKNYEDAMKMYKQALAALDLVNGGNNRVATLRNVGASGGTIRHDDNDMFCSFVDTNIQVEPVMEEDVTMNSMKVVEDGAIDLDQKGSNEPLESKAAVADEVAEVTKKSIEDGENDDKMLDVDETENNETLIEDKDENEDVDDTKDEEEKKTVEKKTRVFKFAEGTDLSSLCLQVGDIIRVGEHFTSKIVAIMIDMGTIEITDEYDAMNTSVSEVIDKPATLSLYVKRENELLRIPEAITVAFNIARLREATGRILSSIELHRAILKRNPAYVNSSLRLACIAVDCGCLKECSEWLKIALTTSPTNPEVRTLIGNLHLSLCDYASAQPVFDGLLAKKVPNVEAYAALSLGNIYFANLHVTDRYAKHLQYAADFYKSILQKDPLNAYAANGLGTILAEKGELFKAKEVFNRVRETSGDNIADALLNLGHIYLAQKKHPEALQMYQNYMKRAEDVSTPVSSKSRIDDVVDVLMYIAFAYFDWARYTELYNDANAAPADGRYKEAMEHLELAIGKSSKKEIVLKYNLCMTKLQAANCILQKLIRNIPRTVEEVEVALAWLQESLVVVEDIVKQKSDKAKKITVPTLTLQNFLVHCRANISSAESHLEDEKKRRAESEAEREIHRLLAENKLKEASLEEAIRKSEEAKRQEMLDRKAEEKMMKVDQLRANWEHEQQAKEAEKAKKARKMRNGVAPGVEDFLVPDDDPEVTGGHGLFDDSDDESGKEQETQKHTKEAKRETKQMTEVKKPSHGDLFGDSDDDENDNEERALAKEKSSTLAAQDLFGNSDDDIDDARETTAKQAHASELPTNEDLFGDSDAESDDELIRPTSGKRETDEKDVDQPNKKRRILEV